MESNGLTVMDQTLAELDTEMFLTPLGSVYPCKEYIYSSMKVSYIWNYTAVITHPDKPKEETPDFFSKQDYMKYMHKNYGGCDYNVINHETWPLNKRELSMLETIISGKIGKNFP